MVWQISWYIYDTGNSCWVWVDPSEPVINSAWFVHMYHYSRVILSLTGGIIFPTPVYQLILNRTRLIRYSYTQSPRWVFSWHVLVYTVSILSVKIDDILPKDVLVWCFWIPKIPFDADFLLQGRHWQVEAWWVWSSSCFPYFTSQRCRPFYEPNIFFLVTSGWTLFFRQADVNVRFWNNKHESFN